MNDSGLSQRSDAWFAVCRALFEAAPGWNMGKGSGVEQAVRAIEQLAAAAKCNAEKEPKLPDWLEQLLTTGTVYVATSAPGLTMSVGIAAPEALTKSARAVDLGGCADQTFYAAEEPKWEPRTALDYLSAAEDAQTARASDYDSPGGERSVGDTVRAFNALTGHDLTEVQGWQFLMLLKLKRLNSAHGVHMDSCVDAVSYASLMAEAQGR